MGTYTVSLLFLHEEIGLPFLRGRSLLHRVEGFRPVVGFVQGDLHPASVASVASATLTPLYRDQA